jgi:hypothetical protein
MSSTLLKKLEDEQFGISNDIDHVLKSFSRLDKMIKDIKKKFENKNDECISLGDFILQSPLCKFMGYNNDRLVHQFRNYPKKYSGVIIKKNDQKNKWHVLNTEKLEEILEKKYLPFSLLEREMLKQYLEERKKC